MNVETFIPNKLFVLKNFLSEAQCGELISRAESLTFSEAMISTRAGQVMDKTVRNNDRILFDDHALAKSCFERAEPFLVRRWFGRKLLSFNERWRFYRYEKGQQFRPHYDGRFVRNEQEQSEFTFLVYLNDDFQGGATRFLDQKRISIWPQTGDALVFYHRQLHEGAVVHAGTKYVLRTDVMYCSSEPDEDSGA